MGKIQNLKNRIFDKSRFSSFFNKLYISIQDPKPNSTFLAMQTAATEFKKDLYLDPHYEHSEHSARTRTSQKKWNRSIDEMLKQLNNGFHTASNTISS